MMRITEEALRCLLREAAKQEGGLRAFAKRHGMTAPYLCNVIKGRRHVSDRAVRTLGLRREVIYVLDRKS